MAGGKGRRGALKGNRYRPRQRKRVGGGRSRADRQLAQGTGRAVQKPFLSAPRTLSLRGWDAFDHAHAALPRATGPYAVVRTTNLFGSSAKFVQFGSFQRITEAAWSNICAVEDVDVGQAVGGTGNTRFRSVPIPGNSLVGSGLTCVPAAISVQIMNPQALQTTSGIVGAAVANTQLDLNNRVETWNDISTEFISYFRPRLMSAGKLALRGVQLNSYPLNMSAVSDFLPITSTLDGSTGQLNGSAVRSVGWAPMVVINENGVPLQYLVSIEWRVRFDIANPAVASHRHHGVTNDMSWNNMLTNAINMGNGVMDIVEKVASAGQVVQQLAGRRAPLMLTAA